MKFQTAGILLGAAWILTSCADHARTGYHSVSVGWPPGHENVPDCGQLIAMQGRSVDISGVNITVPAAGASAAVGAVKVDPRALQNASEAAIRADHEYTRLCRLLPSYTGKDSKEAFYKARDKMFDLISGTHAIAKEVATSTEQAQPTTPNTIPTSAPEAAATAGADPRKAVAIPPQAPSTSVAAVVPTTPPKGSKAEQTRKLNALATKLARVSRNQFGLGR